MDFLRKHSDILREYKTAHCMDGGLDKSFYYYKINTSDYTRIPILKKVQFQQNQITIATTSTLPFDVNSSIKINSYAYTIASIYKVDASNENNYFGANEVIAPVIYIVLNKLY